MKYLCFGYLDEKLWGTKSESEQKAMIDACFSYDEELRRNGAWVGGEGIQGPDNATTLRYQNGESTVLEVVDAHRRWFRQTPGCRQACE